MSRGRVIAVLLSVALVGSFQTLAPAGEPPSPSTHAAPALGNQAHIGRVDEQISEIESLASQATMPPPVRALAETTRQLLQEQSRVVTRISVITQEIRDCDARSDGMAHELEGLRGLVQQTGGGAHIGPRLVSRSKDLPDVYELNRSIRLVRDEILTSQVRLLDLDQEMRGSASIDDRIAAVRKGVPGLPADAEIAGQVRHLLEVRLGAVDSLRALFGQYWQELLRLEVSRKRYLAQVREFRSFIDKEALWVPNMPPLHKTPLPTQVSVEVRAWSMLWSHVDRDVSAHLWVYLLIIGVVVAWCASLPFLLASTRRIDQRVGRPYADSFSLTLLAVLINAMLCIPLPAAMLLASWRLPIAVPPASEAAYDLAQSLSAAFYYPAFGVCTAMFVAFLCRSHGVAETHLLWAPAACRKLRRVATACAALFAPLSLVAYFVAFHPKQAFRESPGRILFIVGMVILEYLIWQLLHPRRGVLALHRNASGASEHCPPRRRGLAAGFVLAMLVPIALALLCFAGYQYAGFVLFRCAVRTFVLALGLAMLSSVGLRFIRVSRQTASIRASAEKAASRAAPDGAPVPPAGSNAAIAKGNEDDLDERAQALLRWLGYLVLVVGGVAIWRDIIPALGRLDDVHLWYRSADAPIIGAAPRVASPGPVPVTLADLLTAIVMAIFTILLVRSMPRLADMWLLVRLRLDRSARLAISSLLRYSIFILGAILSLGQLGIGWSKVQWLVAAASVGLGFGLQEIVANFVSGLVILFERPIRVGDTVTIGNVDGCVSRINIRATVVIDAQNRELIVPNKELITNHIVNWTLSDPVTRVDIPIGIAYGSDVELARRLLLQIAGDCQHILKHPPPQVIFLKFGQSALNLELGVYIPTRTVWAAMIDEMHSRIDKAFRQAGIEIAFPQHDIHIRSIHGAVQIAASPQAIGVRTGAGYEGSPPAS